MSDQKNHHLQALRQRAESILASNQDAGVNEQWRDEFKHILHELHVHQIELELQNEELRTTQIALEESRGRFVQLYDNAPVGYVVLDKGGVIHQTNIAFANMVHRERSHILGRAFGDFIHADDRPIFFARSRAFFKNPADKTLELRLNSRHGTPLYASLRASRHLHLGRDIPPSENELLLTVTNITDRVAAEHALIASEQFARSTVDALSANIAILDETGRIIAVNRAWKEFARGNSAQPDSIGEGANYLTLCQSVQGCEAEAARQFAAGILKVLHGETEIYTQEYTCHSPSEQRWFVGRVTRFPEQGGRRVVVAHENITERKQLEADNLRLLRQLNRREKEESLGRMAGAIAHHFNNLLFVVLGSIELALEKVSADPLVRQYLTFAQDGTNRAAEISGKMLTYLGLTMKDKSPMDLGKVVRQHLPLLEAMKPETATIHAVLPANGPRIVANVHQVEELVTILAENGWEAGHGRLCEIRLTISTAGAADLADTHRFPQAWQPQHQSYACLEVTDNGTGIAPEHLEQIFDPFFSNKFMGRGMGLPLVLGILRAHKGCVTVSSEPDRGTTIRAYFPLPKQPAD